MKKLIYICVILAVQQSILGIEITQENFEENRILTNTNAIIKEGTELRGDSRIIANENASLINKGVINLYERSNGMLGFVDGLVINDSDGIINAIGERTWGMYTTEKGVIINKGIINLIGEDTKGICVYREKTIIGRNIF